MKIHYVEEPVSDYIRSVVSTILLINERVLYFDIFLPSNVLNYYNILFSLAVIFKLSLILFRSHLGMFLSFLLVKMILKLLLNFLQKKLIAIERILQV